MAITPLGNEYKGLEFDGVSSKTYGVMIYGEGVFNAPERDVEMIKIPGRSGTFALDKGRFENIEVTYPARLIADNTADFAAAISDFRNELCSRKGYVRLTDDYHPDEYRMAIYKEGLEVDEQVLRAGEFDIVFDCKPQRWLTSGETAVTIGEWGETETATGDIVTVENEDGILGVKSLSVALDPIQDLHGYDKPWSGGNGKNKFSYPYTIASSGTINGVTYTVNGDGSITLTGTATGQADLALFSPNGYSLDSGTYKITLGGIKNGIKWIYGGSGGALTYNELTHTVADQTINMATSGTCGYCIIRIANGTETNTTLYPMIRLSSVTDASFEPYSNICPISGRTEVVTQRTGKNLLLLDETEMVQSGWNEWFPLTIKAGTYAMSCQNRPFITGAERSTQVRLTDLNRTPIINISSGYAYGDGVKMSFSFSITEEQSRNVAGIVFEPIGGPFVFTSLDNMKNMLELGSTATAYEPYNGTSHTTTLGRTVYGGKLDVVSGELTVDRAMVTVDGSNDEVWSTKTGLPSAFSYVDSSIKDGLSQASVHVLSNYLEGKTQNEIAGSASQYGVAQFAWGTQLVVRIPNITSLTDLKAYLANNPLQVVYELATPTTYQLTPTEVQLLLGNNNVWSEDGDVTVEYGQLPNLLINPTLFESGPLLEVVGTGDITFNGSDITIQAVELGAVQVYGGYTSTSTNPNHIWFDMDMSRLNIGDAITISGVQINNNLGLTSSWPTVKFDNLNITETIDIASYVKGPLGSRDSYVNYTPNNFTFYYGTAATSSTSSIKAYMSAHGPNSEGFSYTRTFTYYADYDGNEHIDIYLTYTTYSYFPQTSKAIIPTIMGDSTVSTLPTPVYIDLDIGEAYGEYSGVIASVNNAVILPAELPTLAPGSNAITFDNTITDLKVVPRWWRV